MLERTGNDFSRQGQLPAIQIGTWLGRWDNDEIERKGDDYPMFPQDEDSGNQSGSEDVDAGEDNQEGQADEERS